MAEIAHGLETFFVFFNIFGGKPCTSFQYVLDTTGIDDMVKYLLISSKAEVEPARRDDITAAPTFIALSKAPIVE